MPSPQTTALAAAAGPAVESIEHCIYVIRGIKVMLDADLAGLYQVPTKVFNQAVKRHRARFPQDFLFQLTPEEAVGMRSHIVTASNPAAAPRLGSPKNTRNARFLPYAFTEHGVAMLSAVLNSPRAVRMNITIIRAFIRLREAAVTNADFARRIEKILTNTGSAHLCHHYPGQRDRRTERPATGTAPAAHRLLVRSRKSR